MKTVAIMQPYLFPYLGYFQLFYAADVFVILDDVQYIDRGWINRNRILRHGEPQQFTFPVARDSSRIEINKRSFSDDFAYVAAKFVRQLKHCYARAPHRSELLTITERILSIDERNVSKFITASLLHLVRLLKIDVEIRTASEFGHRDLNGVDRILTITTVAGGDRYVNPIGGRGLYRQEDFKPEGIELRFLEPQIEPYDQGSDIFVPNLSILDAWAFLGGTGVQRKLTEYRLIK